MKPLAFALAAYVLIVSNAIALFVWCFENTAFGGWIPFLVCAVVPLCTLAIGGLLGAWAVKWVKDNGVEEEGLPIVFPAITA